MANPFRAAARHIAPPAENAQPAAREAFSGASFSRLTSDWTLASMKSADAELRTDLRVLRNRARELDRNSPFAAKYSTLLAEKVIGPTGVRLKAKNLLKDQSDLQRRANAGIEAAWLDWSRPENCDLTRKLSLTENLALIASGWGTDGEILIRLWEGPPGPTFGPYGFKIQVLDPDLLDDQLNQSRMATANGIRPEIRQGVEYDGFGAPAAYWLWKRHPSETGMETTPNDHVRVPWQSIIHTFIPRRPNQSRGIPHAAAIMLTLRMLDGYVEAELTAARIASATMGALEDIPNTDGPTPTANPLAVGGTSGVIPAEATPGALFDLRGKGARLALWDPQHPTTAFPNFTKMMSHYAAMGLAISYGTLTGDLTDASYGSLRVGMIDERDHWRRLTQFIVVHVLDRIYRAWLRLALLNQQVKNITDFDVSRWVTVMWKGRGFDWIDPLKDIQGSLIEVNANVNSLTRLCAERGLDFEEIVAERSEEIRLLEKYGVPSVIATSITDTAGETDNGEDAPPKKTSNGNGGEGNGNGTGGTKDHAARAERVAALVSMRAALQHALTLSGEGT